MASMKSDPTCVRREERDDSPSARARETRRLHPVPPDVVGNSHPGGSPKHDPSEFEHR